MDSSTWTLPCQKAYLQQQAQGRTNEMTERARKEDKASHAELNRLRATGANAQCFDCTASKPGWAVLPWGTFVCIDCAQVHRNLGRHISQTKAINTGTYLWFPHELEVMRQIGNERAARAFTGAPAKPSRDASVATKAEHAREKYELRRWGPVYGDVTPPAPAPATPPPAKPASKPAEKVQTMAPAAPKRPKPASGLPQARRLVPTSTEAVIADLISLDDAAPSPPTPAAAPSPAVDSWAAFSDFADFSDFVTVAPVGAADAPRLPAAAWDQKKAAVLSLFPGTMKPAPSCHFQQHQQQQPLGVGLGQSTFFAAYGL